MELRDYVRVLRTYWRGVLVVVSLGVIAASVYTFTQPKVYAANSTGFVTTGQSDNPALASVNDQLAQSRATSYVDIAKSRATARDAAKDLGLNVDPAALVGKISVTQPLNTVLLQITAKASSPAAARDLADAWGKALATQVASIEDPNQPNAAGIPKVIPVDQAELPKSPVSPVPSRNLFLGFVVGCLLALAYAVVRGNLDRRLQSVEEIEKRGIAVAGLVPTAKFLQRSTRDRVRVAVAEGGPKEGHAAAAEAFRKLRTNLTYMGVDNPPRVIVVTSPNASDGKSTVAANLAAALASTGQNVVPLDADLRRPNVAPAFGLPEGVGLTTALVGQISLQDALQLTSEESGLRVLGAGSIPPNPSELLGTKAMEHLVEELRADHHVIIDAPPLLPVTDAAVLARIADGALLVVAAGKTLDTELDASLEALRAVNANVLGAVMNRAGYLATGYYYAGYYGSTNSGRRRTSRRSRRQAKSLAKKAQKV